MSDTTIRTGPAELLRQVGPNMYREAYKRGMSLSALLEKEDPSSQYPNDGLDAFGRMLAAADIRVRGAAEHGIPASTWEDLNATPQLRALVPEWTSRLWRSVQKGTQYGTRDLYLSDDSTVGSVGNPWVDAPGARWDSQIAPAIPLSSVVATTTSISGDAYRAYYLTTDADQASMTRVAEGADIPRVKLESAENTVRLYKYGRALEATYEQLRRQRLDRIGMFIQYIAVMAEVDKLTDIINIMVNGDGNSNAATSYNLTTLDSDASAGTLTLKAWLAFKMKFANPYMLTTSLATEAVALQMLLLNAGSANVPLVNIQGPAGFGSLSQINTGLRDGVDLGWTSGAPASKILGFDRRFGVEMVYEIGANINEVEQYISNQTQLLTMTETVGYALLDKNAARLLNLAA